MYYCCKDGAFAQDCTMKQMADFCTPMEVDAGKYVSFEEQINNYKFYYYEALRRSSTSRDTNENSYFPFMENFLSTLCMCYKKLDKRFAIVHSKISLKKPALNRLY